MSADYNNLFESQTEEFDLEIDGNPNGAKSAKAGDAPTIEGKLPRDLEGTLFRNGPGVQIAGDDPLNIVDGHGYVAMAVFSRGSCTFKSKHVQTPLFKDEREEKRILRRRMFTNLPSRWKNFFNFDLGATASHDIYAWGGRVLAAHEQGHFDLDPNSLVTKSESRWNKSVPEGHAMCPMPRIDPAADRLVTYSLQPGRRRDEITFYELDDEFRAARRASFELASAPAQLHDIAFTERFYVVCESPARASPMRVLWGKNTVFDAFTWPDGKTASIALASRDAEKRREMFRVDAPDGIREILHFANAYDAEPGAGEARNAEANDDESRDDESGEGNDDARAVVLDAIVYDSPFPFHLYAPPELRERDALTVTAAPKPTLVRLVIDPEKGTIEKKILTTLAVDLPEVNPRFHGKKHGFVYAATASSNADAPDANAYLFFHGIAKIDVESGAHILFDARETCVVSQPAFAPRAPKRGSDSATKKHHVAKDAASTAEDDGYVLFWELDLDAKETSIVVLDAKNMSLVARVKLGVFLPPVSHTSFFSNHA